jgi:hypothetical protein
MTIAHCRECRPKHSPGSWQRGRCQTCGRVVFSLRDERKNHYVACSRQCRQAIYAAVAKAKRPSRDKTCTVCGEAFVAPRWDAVTCSPACRQKAYRQRHATAK